GVRYWSCFFFFQAEDGIRDWSVTGVQTCALPIYSSTVLPAIDTTALAPRESSHGRSRCRKASIPGPCKPIELSMPLLVSAIRGEIGRASCREKEEIAGGGVA